MNRYKEQNAFGFINRSCLSIFAMVLMLTNINTAQAQFAADSCDPQYMESLEARAWLEAQREISQNQNLIFKPDSVLEYTCFHSHLNQVYSAASGLFSENTRWGTSANSLQSNLNSIANANSNYIASNFSHTYLGGRLGSGGSNPPTNVSSSSYDCDVMNQVWEQAKCMDFIHQDSHDGFFTFQEYNDENDVRTLPTACTSTAANSYLNAMNRATDSDASTPWAEDSVDTYFNLFLAGNSGSQACGEDNFYSRIETGLTVYPGDSSLPDDYMEVVCTVPGCYYDPNADKCVVP